MSSLTHAMARAAVKAGLTAGVNHAKKNPDTGIDDILSFMEKHMPSTKVDAQYTKSGTNAVTNFRRFIGDKDSKWYQYAQGILNDIDSKVLVTLGTNLAYEAGYCGLGKARELRAKYHTNFPWVLLMDPTSACNKHCTGCWAAEYGHKLNLSYDEMQSIITQGKELGIYFYLFTGGEPLVRKADVIKLCKANPECEFLSFTNGTLVDEKFCQDMLDVKNLSLAISVEGFEKENDGRRGEGVFQEVMRAMDLLRAHKLLFGVSICWTRNNCETVVSPEFIKLLQDKGVKFVWYFHYMPVGNDASPDLIPTVEQREHFINRVREMRRKDDPTKLMLLDFQNDGQYVGGCIAAGKNYCHINANGDVEPCVFIHYSSANIRKQSLFDCLRQPLFNDYHDHQAFNKNMLRPCPMLENPGWLRKMVKESGAHSTDLSSPEDVEHLCAKCDAYAREWAPVADRIWKSWGNTLPSGSSAAAPEPEEDVKKQKQA